MKVEKLTENDFDRVFVRADRIDPKPTRWLWEGRVPRGAITTLEGDPGGAKSTLLADIAARLTAGRPMPESDLMPAAESVIWLGAEDSADITRNNLRDAGARMENVRIYDKCSCELMLPDAAESIEDAVRRTGAGLVVTIILMCHWR